VKARPGAFTLIELVAIAIIARPAARLLPAITPEIKPI
jgi:type II secretory pathway pseudopilin PulG